MPKQKTHSKKVSGIEFRLPLAMNKTRFKELYGKRFGDNCENIFNQLKAEKLPTEEK